MELKGSYSKRFKFHRGTANGFSSCRRFMDGVDGPTKDLQEKFLHDSVAMTFSSCPLFSDIKQHFSGNRVNGCVDVDVPISKQDWYEIQDFLEMLQKISEGDLIEFCLQYRLDDLQKKGIE